MSNVDLFRYAGTLIVMAIFIAWIWHNNPDI